jgi:RHS repeat-associated protein
VEFWNKTEIPIFFSGIMADIGSTYTNFANNKVAQPYLFGGKEYIPDLGLDWIDFVARPFDPSGNHFWTQDPMAELYYQMSPYAYCHNNPINMIDPNGLTDYMVNSEGVIYKKNPIIDEIKKFFGITDKDDKLIAADNKNNTLELEAGSIGEIGTQNDANGKAAGHSFSVSNDKSAEQVFEFLSENTNVEWSKTEYNNSKNSDNIISTSHDHEKERVGSLILDDLLSKGNDVISTDHSHPDGGPPSGYRPESRNTNDKDVVKYMNKYHSNNNIIYRAYDVSKKGYWIYNGNKIIGFQKKR